MDMKLFGHMQSPLDKYVCTSCLQFSRQLVWVVDVTVLDGGLEVLERKEGLVHTLLLLIHSNYFLRLTLLS